MCWWWWGGASVGGWIWSEWLEVGGEGLNVYNLVGRWGSNSVIIIIFARDILTMVPGEHGPGALCPGGPMSLQNVNTNNIT